MDAADELVEVLSDVRVYALDPVRRRGIAERLANCRITPAQLRAVWAEARSGNDDNNARGLFAQVVNEPARVLACFQDAEDRRRRRLERDSVQGASGIEFVDSANPYGWKEPGAKRWFDDSVPGGWNPYRQQFNLTSDEAREAGVRDVRRHGCSRPEVVGEFDKQRVKDDRCVMATPEWNPDVVAVLKEGRRVGLKEPPQAGRDIYGAGS